MCKKYTSSPNFPLPKQTTIKNTSFCLCQSFKSTRPKWYFMVTAILICLLMYYTCSTSFVFKSKTICLSFLIVTTSGIDHIFIGKKKIGYISCVLWQLSPLKQKWWTHIKDAHKGLLLERVFANLKSDILSIRYVSFQENWNKQLHL